MSTPVDVDAVQVVKDLIAERDRLRRQVVEQEQEIARLREEAERLVDEQVRISKERDDYRRAVYALWPKEDMPPHSEEELEEMRRTAIPVEQILADVDEILGVDRGGHPNG